MNKWPSLLGLAVALCLGFGRLGLVSTSAAAQSYTLDWCVVGGGVNAGVMADLDGDARPQGCGYDLGADELRSWCIYLPLVLRDS